MRADSRINKVWTGSRTFLWIHCHKKMRADSRTNKVWTGSRTYLWIYCHKDFLSWWLWASVKRLLLPVVTNLLWQNPGAPNPVQWQAQHTCVTTREIQDGKRKVIYFRHVDVTIKLNYRYLYYSYISTVPCILLLQHCTMHTFLPYYAFIATAHAYLLLQHYEVLTLCTWLYVTKDQTSCLTTAFLKMLSPCLVF